MSKKRYPDEFKVDAVKQVVDFGHSVAAVAGYLGMTIHSLYTWIKKFGPDFAKHNAMSDDQTKIRRLKDELKRATQGRDLLKKPRCTSPASPSEVRLYPGRKCQMASTGFL